MAYSSARKQNTRSVGCLRLVLVFHYSRFSIQIHHCMPTHKADDREDLPEYFHLLFGLFSGHNIVIFHELQFLPCSMDSCLIKKSVPWHILAPRAVACNSLHLRASAHLWHVSAFLCNRKFRGISCYIKKQFPMSLYLRACRKLHVSLFFG